MTVTFVGSGMAMLVKCSLSLRVETNVRVWDLVYLLSQQNAIDGSTVAISLLSALLPAMSAAMVSSFINRSVIDV